MSQICMDFLDSINYVRSTSALLKSIRDQFDEYLDTMPLPEGTDNIQRANIKLWIHHYMNGNCSMESLKNMMNALGVPELLKQKTHELEVDADGKLTVYEVQNHGDA